MTPEKFNAVVDARKEKISRLLQAKSAEYARGGDRLHNFKRAGRFTGKTPLAMAWMFAMKHLTSIADLVDDIEGGQIVTQAMVDEKLGDAVNYLILMEALFVEGNP